MDLMSNSPSILIKMASLANLLDVLLCKWNASALSLTILGFLVSIVSMFLASHCKSQEQSSKPPTVPYGIPFLKSTLAFAFGGPKFWDWIRFVSHPVGFIT